MGGTRRGDEVGEASDETRRTLLGEPCSETTSEARRVEAEAAAEAVSESEQPKSKSWRPTQLGNTRSFP